MEKENQFSYLPDERPPFGKLILFAFQQILVMFPATVLVAILTGFDIAVTIFASGFATLCFILITGKKIPLFYGSSFSYLAAITALVTSNELAEFSAVDKIRIAQFGIVMSGLISIAVGLIIKRFGKKIINKILPETITGPIALVIGLSLAGTALNNCSGANDAALASGPLANWSWIIALVTLVATVIFSVYLKGTLSQLPIFFGVIVGYIFAAVVSVATDVKIIDFAAIAQNEIIALPNFTLPLPNWAAVFAIMPIAIATIPESTAHLYQLDIYVNDLANKKGSNKKYSISDKLGLNLIGDGIGDIASGMIGGPAGTNYGENISTMALTRNFSVPVLIVAAIITMVISFSGTLSAAVNSIPRCVIGGMGVYLFGVIAAQGIAIMIEKKVDMFDSRNLAVIATILIIGLGGSYINGGMLPIFGIEIPAIATAAIFGILLNLLLSIGRETSKDDMSESATETVEE